MKLTPDEHDALNELMNMGVGRAANMLNQMTGYLINLSIPNMIVTTPENLEKDAKVDIQENLSIVSLKFFGKFSGTSAIVFPHESANKLVTILVGEGTELSELDELKIGTLTEVGNIVINGVMGSIEELLSEYINYIAPVYLEDSVKNLILQDEEIKTGSAVLVGQAHFEIHEKNIKGDIVLIFRAGSFDSLKASIREKLLFIEDDA